MLTFATAFIVSLLSTLLIVHYAHLHEHLSADNDLQGVQKIHAQPVPRIGGIGILLGFIASALILKLKNPTIANDMLLLLACGLPAFIAGITEDLTKSVTPIIRLICIIMAALLAYFVLNIYITRSGFPLIDALLYSIISVSFTVFAVTGLANAINLIDGFNGLASMVALIMFASLAYVAFQVSDAIVLSGSLIMIGATLGFLIWNFPAGLIFLGDGGAYFLGFILGELSILLVMRNQEVSPWYPLLMAMYPIFETCFSIYRRRFVRGTSPGMPDGVHLHMLIYKRIMRWAVGPETARALTRRNSLTSPYLWLLSLCAIIPATLFWKHTMLLICFVLAFAVAYIWLYARIVRLRAPKYLFFPHKKKKNEK